MFIIIILSYLYYTTSGRIVLMVAESIPGRGCTYTMHEGALGVLPMRVGGANT